PKSVQGASLIVWPMTAAVARFAVRYAGQSASFSMTSPERALIVISKLAPWDFISASQAGLFRYSSRRNSVTHPVRAATTLSYAVASSNCNALRRLRHFVLLTSCCSTWRGPSLIWLPSADRSSSFRFPFLYTTDTSQTLSSPSQSIFDILLCGNFRSVVLAAANSPWSSGCSASLGP